MYSKESIDSFMIDLFNKDIKNVFVQVRSRGDALYNSSIVKKNKNIKENFDPLSYVILLGRLLDIKVHAWLNTYLIWSANSPPDDSTHIYYLHPEWFESDYSGKSDIDIKLENIQTPTWEGLFLSPNNPEVNSYLLKLVKELFFNYPNLDGLHFDYIRFQDDFYGFNQEGIKDFKIKNNFNPKDIYRDIFSLRYGWSNAELDSIKNIRIDYNSKNITMFLTSVSDYRNSINSNIVISAAVKSDLINARSRWFQNWGKWVEENIVDFVIPMNYSNENDVFFQRINMIPENINTIDYKKKIIMGISIYNQDESSISEKILLSTLSGYNRICFFSYNSLKEGNINYKLIRDNYNKKKYLLGE